MKNIELLMHFSYQHTRVMWQVMSVELSVQIVHISHRSGLIHARTISCACRWEHSWLMKLSWLFVDCVFLKLQLQDVQWGTQHILPRDVFISVKLRVSGCSDWCGVRTGCSNQQNHPQYSSLRSELHPPGSEHLTARISCFWTPPDHHLPTGRDKIWKEPP